MWFCGHARLCHHFFSTTNPFLVISRLPHHKYKIYIIKLKKRNVVFSNGLGNNNCFLKSFFRELIQKVGVPYAWIVFVRTLCMCVHWFESPSANWI